MAQEQILYLKPAPQIEQVGGKYSERMRLASRVLVHPSLSGYDPAVASTARIA